MPIRVNVILCCLYVYGVHDAFRYYDALWCSMQGVMEEMQRRESGLVSIPDLHQQLQALGEEVDVSATRQQLYTVNQDWTELSLRLARYKGVLQVRENIQNRCTEGDDTKAKVMAG